MIVEKQMRKKRTKNMGTCPKRNLLQLYYSTEFAHILATSHTLTEWL